jgi:hypothetical protein
MKRAAVVSAAGNKRLHQKDARRLDAWRSFKAEVWCPGSCAALRPFLLFWKRPCGATAGLQHHVGPLAFRISQIYAKLKKTKF